MALGKRKSSDFMPTFKYDARIGTVYLQDRVLSNGSWQPEQKDVTDILRTQGAIFDIAGGLQGWIRFVKGAAPDMLLVPFGSDAGEAPSPDHKEGVRLVVKHFPKTSRANS